MSKGRMRHGMIETASIQRALMAIVTRSIEFEQPLSSYAAMADEIGTTHAKVSVNMNRLMDRDEFTIKRINGKIYASIPRYPSLHRHYPHTFPQNAVDGLSSHRIEVGS